MNTGMLSACYTLFGGSVELQLGVLIVAALLWLLGALTGYGAGRLHRAAGPLAR
jgi:hypothetical protein